MIIAEVEKNNNESNASVMRRFSKKIRSLGHLKLVRTLRYAQRPKSALKKKQDKLKRIAKYHRMESLKKYGKLKEVTYYNK